MKGAQSANVCLEYLCNSRFFFFPPVVTSFWDKHRANSDSATFNVCQSPRTDCLWKRPSQFARRCLRVRRAVFFHSPSPQVSMKVMARITQFMWCGLGCANGQWHGGRDAPVHACGTRSQVAHSAQMPSMGNTVFNLFLKGRAGS